MCDLFQIDKMSIIGVHFYQIHKIVVFSIFFVDLKECHFITICKGNSDCTRLVI
ncbi:hypothetical protein Javan116_0007 [Streptococcus phage Javan116]|nr:hypothetical protein Javan116_0007 [Streptococcus phage Javan116]